MLPRRKQPKRLKGFFKREETSWESLWFDCLKSFIRLRDRLKNAVSEPEKKAEQHRRMNNKMIWPIF